MKVTRRDFIKATAAAAGIAALADFSFKGPLTTLLTGPHQKLSPAETWVSTTCWIGKQDCGMLARVIDGRISKFEGHPDHPRNFGTLCVKGVAQISAIYDPYRVKAPLRRTNAKGQPGVWEEISWDTALTLVGDRIQDVIARDPRLLVWQKGRSKAKDFYDTAFVNASGATKLHHGAYCSDAGYRACEYTVGLHGVLHPDFKYTNYLISFGWNLVGAGGNKLCWLTWPHEFLEAKERGMKVINLDPRHGSMGPHADEWLPIKPATDIVFFHALSNLLIENGTIDTEYLKNNTNAPFLVQPDGFFERDGLNNILVWDLNSASKQPHDTVGIDPALEVDAGVGQTAYQLFKNYVANFTPENAESICGIAANKIRQIAQEIADNAQIGATINIDGSDYIHRPVGMMAYHVSQTEIGFQTMRAAMQTLMLLGSIEAVGGTRIEFKRKVDSKFTSLDTITITDPPYDLTLNKSKFYPINSNNTSLIAHALRTPQSRAEFGLDFVPEVMIVHMANPVLSFLDQERIHDFLSLFQFIAVIDPWMSETADYYADVVLPSSTIEKYEGPLDVGTQYVNATSLRLPPIPPLFDTRGDIDIYLDLCEKAGILFGSGGYLDQINSALSLDPPNDLALDTKPTVREIFDKWAKDAGYTGVDFFEQNSVDVSPKDASTMYASTTARTSGGIKHRLYGESLLGYQQTMQSKGADQIFWQDYTPLPIWRAPTMDQSPSSYDLILISYKKIEFKQSRSTFIPLLNELEPRQELIINSQTAAAKGISNGDECIVESHNAVTGETRSMRAKAKVIEGIRPDTVALSHHYGFWVHPKAKDGGQTPNILFFSTPGYVSNTADQSFHVRVMVTKA